MGSIKEVTKWHHNRQQTNETRNKNYYIIYSDYNYDGRLQRFYLLC